MKSFVAALLAAAVAIPSVAIAGTVYDPAENEFTTAPDNSNSANVAAASASADRLSETVRIWDPVESVFVEYRRAPDSGSASAISTNDSVPMKRVWDPVEAEFIFVPAL